MKNVDRVYEILNKHHQYNENNDTRGTSSGLANNHNNFRSSFHNQSRKKQRGCGNNNSASTGGSRLDKARTVSKSNEDLINLDGGEESGGGCEFAASEEARLAEEAVAANLKLIKRQKAKFLRLQRILSRNQFIIPMCVLFTIASSLATYGSTLTDFYEFSSFNVSLVEQKIVQANEDSLALLNSITLIVNFTLDDVMSRNKSKLFVEIVNPFDNITNTPNLVSSSSFSISSTQSNSSSHPKKVPLLNIFKERHQEISFYELITPNSADEYFTVNKFDYLASDNSIVKTNILWTTHSGIWRVCNYLSNQTRKQLSIDRCIFYREAIMELNNDLSNEYTNDATEDNVSDPRRDLIRTHNAAACCAIVCYILLAVTWITSLISAVTKKVPPTLASCVLNSLIAVFNLLLVAIYHRKILAEMKQSECFDLNILFDVVCSSRTVTIGYSLGASWLSLVFTTANAVCWFHIAKMQKLLFSNGLIA